MSTERGSFKDARNSHIALKTLDEQPKGTIRAHLHLPSNASDFRIYIYEITESKTFGGAILFVILANTVALIAQTSESLVLRGGKIPSSSLLLHLNRLKWNSFRSTRISRYNHLINYF